MPFLAPLIPAIVGGVAAAGTGAAVNALAGSNKQAPGAQNLNLTNFQTDPLAQQGQGQVQGQLGAQTALENQLSGQIGNQAALQQQLAAQNGIGNQSNVYNQQQALANQLAAQSMGAGPNPAQAALAQNTGVNAANQAALMASQRGASANPALLARQAAQQGAATQQQAVGQAATLQAQQQLGAEQALQNQQQALAGLATTQIGQQVQNQQNLSAQQLQNTQNLTGQQLANQQAILGAIASQNATQAGIQNTQQAGQNQQNLSSQNFLQNAVGGVSNAAGGAANTLLAPSPPPAAPLAHGGYVPNPKLGATKSQDRFPAHAFMPPHLKQMASLYHGHSFGNAAYQPQQKMAVGGDVKAYSGQTNSLNMGSSLKSGGKVPGKAQVAGDSLKNDVVDAKLSPGEMVIPKSVMDSDDPVSGAAQFVAAEMKKKKGVKAPEGDFKEALKRAIQGRKKK